MRINKYFFFEILLIFLLYLFYALVLSSVDDNVAQDRIRYFENFSRFHENTFYFNQLLPDNFLRSLFFILIPNNANIELFSIFWTLYNYLILLGTVIYILLKYFNYKKGILFLIFLFIISDRLIMDLILNVSMSTASLLFSILAVLTFNRSKIVSILFYLISVGSHLYASAIFLIMYLFFLIIQRSKLISFIYITSLIIFLVSFKDMFVLDQLSIGRINQSESKFITLSIFIQMSLLFFPVAIYYFKNNFSILGPSKEVNAIFLMSISIFCLSIFVPQALRFSIIFIFFMFLVIDKRSFHVITYSKFFIFFYGFFISGNL